MLSVYPRTDRKIHTVTRENDRLYLRSEGFLYRLEPKTNAILRVTVTGRDGFSDPDKPGIVMRDVISDWGFQENEDEICLNMNNLQVRIDRDSGSFAYYGADGRLLLRERSDGSKELEEFTTYRLAAGGRVKKETVETADGKKEVIRSADRVEAEKLYHTRLHLEWQPGEQLYGLGQQEEGICNLRGQTVYLHQANRKIAVPLLVSGLGYGLLTDTYSPMIFSDTDFGSYLYTEADWEMDFYFINGGTPEGVIKGYRLLTGKASMLPKWAYGYIQSQERYETGAEILKMAEEYRRRGLGLDALVLDWCSWEDGKWGQKSLDHSRFPDAEGMIDRLHELNVRFIISIWPNMDPVCGDYQEFAKAGLLLPGSSVYNALEEKGRGLYWEQLKRSLFAVGTDGWWCDSSEPYTPEWNHLVRQEPAAMYAEYCRETEDHIPAWQINAFSLYHAMGIYEGQRGSASGKRVFNLTRSAYTGQQRYGTVMWSGDTGASWECLRRQIGAGLSFCASGMPYWTADIGAFFVKRGEPWYWDGEYPDTTEDLGYRELFVRWFQWGCFLPVFRGHGTDCRRELWQFEKECGDSPAPPFYEALVKMNRLRYRLMPYIYSTAGAVWREDASFIRMLAFAFPQDARAAGITDQYLFGDSIMVCPVTFPMYYGKNSQPLPDVPKTRQVYLPDGGWYDFWNGRYFEGGRWIEAEAEIDAIPLFVREGSIVPMTEFAGFAAEDGADRGEYTVRIYTGRNAEFALYEDAGDGCGYEEGEYCLRKLLWNEERQELAVRQEHGSPDMDNMAAIKEIICVSTGKL